MPEQFCREIEQYLGIRNRQMLKIHNSKLLKNVFIYYTIEENYYVSNFH